MMKDYRNLVTKNTTGGTPRLCRTALKEYLQDIFEGQTFSGQNGRKALNFFEQALPLQEMRVDDDVDTDAASAPFILVEMNGGTVADPSSPQLIDFSIAVCCYEDLSNLEGMDDVEHILSQIVDAVCSRPYFGGVFTVLYPFDWREQKDDTAPYYWGAVSLICTAPALTQDAALEEFL